MHVIEQRKTQRFEIQLPVEVLRAGGERFSENAHTRNISSGGLLFVSKRRMDVGGPIEYVVSLMTESGTAVHLRCMGKVLRLEKLHPAPDIDDAFAVAATLERYEFLRPNGHAAGR
ncbi:MAG: PilZ domain-containing protein [Bryobacteraceae bacterium]